jgi:hypothetical protein
MAEAGSDDMAAAEKVTRRRAGTPATPPSTKSKERMLWDAACSIRGEKDAAKFKDDLLPLLFLNNPKFKAPDSKIRTHDIVVANPMWNQPFNPDIFAHDPFRTQGGATSSMIQNAGRSRHLADMAVSDRYDHEGALEGHAIRRRLDAEAPQYMA